MNAETKCKNCGYKLGLHHGSNSECPTYDANAGCYSFKGNSVFDCDELPPLPEKKEGAWPKKFQAREGLRKVEFIERDWKKNGLPGKPQSGVFHQFGIGFRTGNGEIRYPVPMQCTTAIVEAEDGRVLEIPPSDVKFIS